MPSGNEKIFIAMYEKYSNAIYRHCFFRVYEEQKAADLTQITFMKVWKYLADGGQIKNFQAFLYKVATNLIIDDVKKRKTESLELLEEQGFNPSVEELEKNQTHIDLEMALSHINKLPPDYKEVLLLRYGQDLSPKEISQILDEPINVISVRIHRGTKKLIELLKDYE